MLFDSPVLEIAMGLVLIYAFIALLATSVTEWIAGIVKLRSKTLEQGIRNLLNDPEGTGLARQFFNHPLIRSLGQSSGKAGTKPDKKPSYIPSRHFALALLDVIAPAGDKAGTIEEIREVVGKIDNAHLQKPLTSLLDAAEGDLNRGRALMENWFDHTMDGVSEWYARKARLIAVVVACLVAFGMNADTIMIADTLSKSATVRAALVGIAENASPGEIQVHSESGCADPADPSLVCQIERADVPLGWADDREGLSANSLPRDLGAWLVKILGLIITSLAASLGAPVWFDLLNKLVNIRLAGTQPGRSERVAA